MKLKFTELRKFSKLLSALSERGTQVGEALLIDTKRNRIQYVSKSTLCLINVNFEKQDGEADDQFFVSKSTFLALAREYPEVELRGRTFITPDGEYQLSPFEDKGAIPPDFSAALPEVFAVPADLSGRIHSAIEFVESSPTPLNGIFFFKGRLIGTDRAQFYEYTYDKTPSDKNIPIPLSLIKLFDLLPSDGEVVFSQSENIIRMSYRNELVLQVARSTELACPNSLDPSFQVLYNHQNFFEISKNSFMELVSFMRNFVQDAPSNRVRVSFPSSTQLMLEATDFAKAKRSIPVVAYSDFSYFEDSHFWMSSVALDKILKKLDSDNIRVRFSKEGAAVDFFSDENLHIVAIKLMEE